MVGERKPRKVPIEWNIPDGLPTRFANHMLVTHIDGQFILTFLEAIPPPILEGQEEKLKKLETLNANAFARIAVPPQVVPGFIRALQRNYERFLEQQKAGEDEKER